MAKPIRTEAINCDLCGSSQRQILYPADSRCGPIVQCCNCGLVYSCPREVFTYADERNHKGYCSQTSGKRLAFDFRLKVLTKHVASGRLLEVGAHHGFFLQAAQERGWEVLGIEPDPEGCEWAKSELHVNMLPQTFADAQLPCGSFDVVALFNVLEHLPSPTEALTKAAALLKPGGVVFVEIPYIFTTTVKIFGKRWFHFEPTHYYYFSEKTLVALMEKTGYKVRETRFLPKFMSPDVVVGAFANHMALVKKFQKPLNKLFDAMGLTGKHFRLRSRDFLGMIARKCS